MEVYDIFEYDVLVIGAGGSGLRAAIAAKEAGVNVGVACKSLLGKAHTVMAEGGAAAALNTMGEDDSWQTHFVDTMRGGEFINNWRTVEIFSKEAIDRVLELERYGAVFDRTPEGFIAQRPFGGHKYRRLNHVGDRTGLELIRTMQDAAVGRGVKVHMEITITKLLTSGGRITGAFGYYRDTGKYVAFKAKAIVLATGGWGRMYKHTSNSWESTGDGVMLAYNAGAELMDMEMVQFHPTGMLWPPGMRGILVTEGVRGEGGILRNKKGERFMFNPEYMPPESKGQYADTEEEAARWLDDKKNNRRPPELLKRDVVARAIYKEIKAGRGTEHGGVYLDVSHRGASYIKRKLPSMYEQFHALGDVDITKEPMEICPTVHYTMGGIRTEPETCASNVPGLYSAGESAAGLHGANRLGGNSLTDILVFGKRSGEGASEYAKSQKFDVLDETAISNEMANLESYFNHSNGENPYTVASELQESMQNGAMIERSEASLTECLNTIISLQKRAENLSATGGKAFNPGWNACTEIKFMLITSEIIVRSALERKESRGAQWRSDYPNKDEEWGKKNILAVNDGGAVKLVTNSVPAMPDELKKLFD